MRVRSAVRCYMSLNQEKPKNNEAVYYSAGLCYCTETKYCLLLLRMARMEMGCILKI